MTKAILRIAPGKLALAAVAPFVVALAGILWAPTTAAGRAAFATALAMGIAIVLIWCWVVGTALHQRLARDRRSTATSFNIATLYVACYTAVFIASVGGGPVAFLLAHPALFAALHLLAMVAVLKILFFIGNNLQLAEGNPTCAKGSSWYDVLTLLSVGDIVAIQSRVNRIFCNDEIAGQQE